MAFTQDDRLISLKVDGMDKDKFLLASFTGHEAISRLFTFNLELLVQSDSVETNKIVGKSATISIKQSDGKPRFFNGIVSQLAYTGFDLNFTHYQMQVVPWTWKLTRRADCQIFHNKKVGDIIEAIFKAAGLTDYKLSLNATYTPAEYCVQYRETDFNFISRLMEHYGIFYFFQHEMGKHTMVIADAPSSLSPCPGQATVRQDPATGGIDDDDVITFWTSQTTLRAGTYSLSDYNFKTPSTSLQVSDATIVNIGQNNNFEVFDYPGDYNNITDGTNFAKLRMQEEETGLFTDNGSSNCRAFTTGYTFSTSFSDSQFSYALTEIQHVASAAGGYVTGGGPSDTYSNHFNCIDASIQFRPTRLTPKPFVQGPQTALVVGKKSYSDTSGDGGTGDGEEIWMDEFGRVVVWFYWDRKVNCSCRVRVAQPWAGNGWGHQWIPRVGDEVVVTFLEGDPDRPLITGSVYNGNNAFPFVGSGSPAMPLQTQSGVKTRSTPGGSADNCNIIRFEDKKGAEDLLIHAELTMHNSVEADQFITVGADRHITVGSDKDPGSLMEHIFGNRNLHVKNEDTVKIEEESHLHVMKDADATYDANRVQSIAKKYVVLADTIQLQAQTKLVLMAGSSSIVIDSGGVTVTGTPMIKLNSPGAPPTPEIAPIVTDPDEP